MIHPAILGFLFDDPVLLGLVVIMLGFVFFVFLFLRRITTGFKEGMEKGQGKRKR
jgi:hypothetical protein